jgi:hypothetical protein
LLFTWKLQLLILPPDTVHVFGSGTVNRPPAGPELSVNETEVSSEFQPEPVTVTVVPVGPMF